ncbi:MAG: SDR family oxidoreductase [Candidatus Dormibacteraeota bacterium]|nr:SDR family oxidoreductase [Candidatus Dormibacteraeota bacterium]
MDLGLRGHTAFVSAASQGLGRGTALAFAREGCHVGLCARDDEALSSVAAEVTDAGVRAIPSVADVTDAAAVGAAIEATLAATGRLDALVVNGGGPPPGTFDDASDEAWHDGFELLVMGAVNLVRAALPALRRSESASIVFFASTSVKQPIPNLMLSNSLRSAVSGLAKSLAMELAPGIRVNSILTGRIRTARTEALARHGNPAGDVEETIARQARAIPLLRYGTVEEFANVAVFLSSPAAGYVTAAALPVDGGVIQAVL